MAKKFSGLRAQISPDALVPTEAGAEAMLGEMPRPSILLSMKRDAMREAVKRFRAENLRIFGSVLHGTDREGSDIDLLVDVLPGATLFDLGGLQDELESLLGVHVDLVTPADLPQKFRVKVLAEAEPI
jgi:predicted nucleotidyltransferase